MKRLLHLIEAALFFSVMRGFRTLPLDIASFAGGALARIIGPRLAAHRTARENLMQALPSLSESEVKALLRGMWDNLGRVVAELAHIDRQALHDRVEIIGKEYLLPPYPPAIFVSAHMGNWELTYALAFRNNIPLTLVYRRINNPYIEEYVAKLRGSQCFNLIPKGPKNGFKIVRSLKNKESLAMLIDQKMNDGIPIPFFGKAAMTATAPAELALQFDLPIIPARIIRTRGVHFRAEVYPPVLFNKSGDQATDIRTVMGELNTLLEHWIREHPEQWFWVHRRWPKQEN